MREKSEHARLHSVKREREQEVLSETAAKQRIADIIELIRTNREERNNKAVAKANIDSALASVRASLPPTEDKLGRFASKVTSFLNKDAREAFTREATLKNSSDAHAAEITELNDRFNFLKAEIDNIVLGILKGEARWRKASTVERSIVVLKVASRTYKTATDRVRHRANGILEEKNDTELAPEKEVEEGRGGPSDSYKKELEILLLAAYTAGDAFQKAFEEYVSASEKPPPWKIDLRIGKNVDITVDLLQNRELLNIYTPETIGALEERLKYLSERLVAARKEINEQLKRVRQQKNSYFHEKKKRLSEYFA